MVFYRVGVEGAENGKEYSWYNWGTPEPGLILSPKAFRELYLPREITASVLELQKTFIFVLYQALRPRDYIGSNLRLPVSQVKSSLYKQT